MTCRWAGGLVLLALPALGFAHMVSISTGELRVNGKQARFELKMPVYEAEHARDPARSLLASIHFHGARMLSSDCRDAGGTYTCVAEYQFDSAPDAIGVECGLAAVTVPNHVHVLRAYRDDKTDQAVFDASYTSAEIRFLPPAPWEMQLRETGAGFLKAIGGLAPLLFLTTLALAARSRREVAILAAALVAGETAACLVAPRVSIVLQPRFIEAAAALSIAYLAFEILLLPNSGQRWLVVALLGLFHGAYFSLFLVSTGYTLWGFLSGVIAGELLVLMALYFGFTKLSHTGWMPRFGPALATLLLVAGLGWFVLRVWA